MKRVLPWVWTGVSVIATAWIAIDGSSGFTTELDWFEQISFLITPVLFSTLGSLILIKQPGNWIAWLFYLVGFGGILDGFSNLIIDGEPAVVTAAIFISIVWSHIGFFVSLLIPLFLLLFLFPTGHFLTRRWSWGGWLAVIAWVSVISTVLFREQVGWAADQEDWTIDNPIGFLPGVPFAEDQTNGALELVFGLSLIALLVGGVLALVVRYRRSDITVRTQIKWVMYSLLLFVVAISIRLFWEEWASQLWSVVLALSLSLIPITITIAIVRYRLFDIDRLISRTIGYALVLVLLAGVYLLGAVWLPTQLLGEQPPIFVAGSTLAIVGFFAPLRKRILGWVDRRFYRSRYQAVQVLESFSHSIRETMTPDALAVQLKDVVAETLQPITMGIWIPERD